MIDEAGTLITSVHASKRLPDGRRAYVLDAGVNLLFTSFWYRFNIEFDRPALGIPEPSILYGPLCMNIDVVDERLSPVLVFNPFLIGALVILSGAPLVLLPLAGFACLIVVSLLNHVLAPHSLPALSLPFSFKVWCRKSRCSHFSCRPCIRPSAPSRAESNRA